MITLYNVFPGCKLISQDVADAEMLITSSTGIDSLEYACLASYDNLTQTSLDIIS